MAKKSRRKLTPIEQLHADWLGMLQPEGLVVAIPVLVEAGAYTRQSADVQGRIRAIAPDSLLDRGSFFRLLTEVLGWPEARLLRGDAELARHRVLLPDLGLHLVPDAILVDTAGRPAVVIRWSEAPSAAGKDDGSAKLWEQDRPEPGTRFPLSRQTAFERLLTELQRRDPGATPIGMHAGPRALRLTYAPGVEAPGSLTFPVDALLPYDGRILVDALCMLLGRERLFDVPSEHRLRALLTRSRERQEEVTTALAGQVKEALAVLVSGFNVADQRTRGQLLTDWRAGPSEHEERARLAELRDGFTAVILRLVFLLYCEDARDGASRSILPVDEPLYQGSYAVGALADHLASDRARFQESMSSRFGAWAQLCALFRIIFKGVGHQRLTLPPRQGELFDPDRHPFLEGRVAASRWETDPADDPPIDDGVVQTLLENLVFLEGQRVSYRNLGVEQIGSVYEALMEMELRRAGAESYRFINGVVLGRDELAASPRALELIAKSAGTRPVELAKKYGITAEVVAARTDWAELLAPLLARDGLLRPGNLYLEAGDERRHSGSHYTPVDLTRPIVIRTLDPVLGDAPTSERILSLKVCDPAMGSGAFLAEACRQLARRLVLAWIREGRTPTEAQQDPELVARRMIAERCLYGVDKNPFAVTLARLSLWLVTLAREMPFTFVDHALAEGDSVIGLSHRQIECLDFEARQTKFSSDRARKNAVRAREQILARQEDLWRTKRDWLREARRLVELERVAGDVLIAAEWQGGTQKQVKDRRSGLRGALLTWYSAGGGDLHADVQGWIDALTLRPFHWELEFPEVFLRDNPGFDAVIGNPPFGGKNTILAQGGKNYIVLLQALQPHAHGNSDLVAHFFLRAASLLRRDGCFGLVATNTIKQGDTRETGLKYLIEKGGITLYDAVLDQPWANGAAVVVDVVHGCKGGSPTGKVLNSMLEVGEELSEPVTLGENEGKSFQGSIILGMGFVLTVEEAERLIEKDPRNAEIVKPYIGGEELNNNLPDGRGFVRFDRYVVDFGERTLEEAEAWPELIERVRERVKPDRDKNNRETRRINWWKFAERAPALYRALSLLPPLPPPALDPDEFDDGLAFGMVTGNLALGLGMLADHEDVGRALACARVSKHHLFTFVPTTVVASEQLVVFTLSDFASFALLQSSVHCAWSRNAGLASTLETRARYTPSTCFETFPFPRASTSLLLRLSEAGERLYIARTAAQRDRQLGLTKLWNLVEDPAIDDADIVALRARRDDVDHAVLAAYGWSDLAPNATPEIVRRLRALNTLRAARRDGTPPRSPMRSYGPYLTRLHIRNLKLIADLPLTFTLHEGKPPPWVALIGENGTGKTSILQSIALAAVGARAADELAGRVRDSLRDRREGAVGAVEIEADFTFTRGDAGARELPGLPADLAASEGVTLRSEVRLPEGSQRFRGGSAYGSRRLAEGTDPLLDVRDRELGGWFVVGYGVFRDLPDPMNAAPSGSGLSLERLSSLFRGSKPLVATSFANTSGEKAARFRKVFAQVLGLLPGIGGAEFQELAPSIESAAERHLFQLGGLGIPSTWLSHGYQSSIAWIADLIGHFIQQTDEDIDAAEMDGLVLIDEIDLYIHPTWQVKIIRAVKQVFPRLQFIITTHSPLVLAGLRPDRDQIIRLELNEETRSIQVRPPDEHRRTDPRMLMAGELLQIYFGVDDVHPDPAGRKLQDYRYLAANPYRSDAQDVEVWKMLKELRDEDLDPGFEPQARREVPQRDAL